MLNRLFPCLLGWLLVLTACQPAKDANADATTPPAPSETAIAADAADPGLPFPVYEDFAQLAPIFQHQNDTTYVINFWATWCKPCIAEMPYFEQLHDNMSDEKVKVILVSLDFPKDVDTKLRKFVVDRQLKPQVIALTDTRYNEWIDQVSPEWGGAIPITLIYRKDKKLFHDGQYADYAELEASVKKVMP